MRRKLLALPLPFGKGRPSPSTGAALAPETPAPNGAGPARWALQHALQLLALALVGTVAAFALYYYADRQVDSGTSLVNRQTAALEEAVRAQPDSFSARLALAKAYESSRNYPGAIEQYQAALVIQPDNIEASLGLGRSQQSSGDMAGAKTTFQTIVEQRQDSEFAVMDDYLRDARYYLGEIYLAEGQYATAIEHLEGALSIDSVDADAWWKLCEGYLGSGDYAQAVDACRRATQLVPNFTEAYQLMAQAYQQAGQPLPARYAAAMASYSLGEHSAAVSELTAVVGQDPGYWDAYVGLSLALEAKGDRQSALAAYQQALSGDPQNLLASMGVSRLGEGHP